ncbi:uncharacterized protein MONOS_16454 [Monocercomonoides exilis]|uniref:uncharacterized protein n=1 Tax=Monocercomonoides exilis TaxID=2049356 RepID=UPI00355A2FA4|nr:hypothetical protein MONOS_16454 [Monocercomonoides exilis]|eukprot:MONOS_16454.1-p1 / transcript=MONOS_16454.1 / gene=MONOS_16454 / organism=Monocercomonoides_exilis_PA203 / gene_product=unspecified product / transcript_product=unspecified product / location=Mono_scaffold01752:1909-3513(-) / protein_length=534 / sequence_SO=supercontig / SO=protein_coding / is_pseudo=false
MQSHEEIQNEENAISESAQITSRVNRHSDDREFFTDSHISETAKTASVSSDDGDPISELVNSKAANSEISSQRVSLQFQQVSSDNLNSHMQHTLPSAEQQTDVDDQTYNSCVGFVSSFEEDASCSSRLLINEDNCDEINWWLKEEAETERIQQKEFNSNKSDKTNCDEENEPIPPALIILDGHSSRQNLQLWLQFASENVDVVVIPAHTSHILQPLDLGPNAVLKSQLKKVKNEPSIKKMKNEFMPFVRAIADCVYYALAPKTIRHGFFEAGITSSSIAHVVDQTLDSLPPEVKPARNTSRWSISGKCITDPEFLTDWELHEKEKELLTNEKKRQKQTKFINSGGCDNCSDLEQTKKIPKYVSSEDSLEKMEQSPEQIRAICEVHSSEEETEPSDSQEGEDNILGVQLFPKLKHKSVHASEQSSSSSEESQSECNCSESDFSSSSISSSQTSKKTRTHSKNEKIKKKRLRNDSEQDYENLDNTEDSNEDISETTKTHFIPKIYSTRSIKTMTSKYLQEYVVHPDFDEDDDIEKL